LETETIILIILTPFFIVGALELLIGFIRLYLHVHPPYRHLLKKGILLEDKTCSFFRSWGPERFWSIIMTDEYLILKNSYLTSIANIRLNEVESYNVKRSLLSGKRKNIFLYLKEGTYSKDVFKFCTKNFSQWEHAFSRIGVKKRESEE
jgi:hypothetical protein